MRSADDFQPAAGRRVKRQTESINNVGRFLCVRAQSVRPAIRPTKCLVNEIEKGSVSRICRSFQINKEGARMCEKLFDDVQRLSSLSKAFEGLAGR